MRSLFDLTHAPLALSSKCRAMPSNYERFPCLLAGKVTLELYEALTAIQQQSSPDPFGWVVPVV